MMLTITNNESEVIHGIDLNDFDLNNPIAKQFLISEIIEAVKNEE